MDSLIQLQLELQQLANSEQQAILQRFFKTKPGEYGEGDIFLGIKVPRLRQLAKKYQHLALNDIQILLHHSIHEYRFLALILLIHLYNTAEEKAALVNFYLQHTEYINNWDLVDISAPKILGHYLFNQPREVLYSLARSPSLWERRIAIIATLPFIKSQQFQDTLALSDILLLDKQDLIHKAVGWMLREVGKQNQEVVKSFLQQHYQYIPRTMLRYAIEKFDEKLRQQYLKKTWLE
jgi:3-methyladenine DNA glycosylase AlkD